MKNKTKQSFMENLLKGTDFKVVNGLGVVALPDDRVAKLSIQTRNTHGQYEKLTLEIVNKKEGRIDCLDFKFSEHLVPDQKNTHQNASFKDVKVIEHCGWDWYIDYPTQESQTKLISTITDYLKYFV